MIRGTVTSQGVYADGKDMCQIIISRETSASLPHQHGEKKKIYLNIGNETYKAGVHETQKGDVWLSSVLYKEGLKREKKRLVDALAEIHIFKGDKIILYPEERDSFILEILEK
jgi:hypothetical protein